MGGRSEERLKKMKRMDGGSEERPKDTRKTYGDSKVDEWGPCTRARRLRANG
jgi:hypothetical protein